MDNWYYKLFGDEFGPVTFEALVELAKGQTLAPDDEVRFGENGPWRRAGSMGQLMTHMPSGAHLPSASSSASMPAQPASSTTAASPKSAEPTGWYYEIFGEQFGPLTFEDLVELAKNHTLSADDEVRFGETGAWRRAGSIGQLMAHLPFQAGKSAFSIEIEPTKSESGTSSSDEEGYSLAQEDPLEDQDLIQAPLASAATTPVQSGSKSSRPPKPPIAETAPPAPAKEDLWWCMISGKEYGPVELPKLIAWAASGRLLRKDFVRRGLDAYIVADELPGLFPELPSVAAVETKSEIKSVTRSMSTSNPSLATPTPAADSLAASSPASPPSDAPSSTPRPTTNWQTNAGGGAGGGFTRPAVPAAPIRRPPTKGGSADLSKFLMPALGVGGILLLGGLIYLALPFLVGSPDVANFKALRAAYSEIQKVRSDDSPKKEELDKAAKAMVKAVKEVEPKLKGKTPANTKLKALAKKLQDLTKEDLTKVGDAEKAVGKSFESLAKLLKVK